MNTEELLKLARSACSETDLNVLSRYLQRAGYPHREGAFAHLEMFQTKEDRRMLEKLEDLATAAAQDEIDPQKWVEINLPELPKGALWPDSFQTTGVAKSQGGRWDSIAPADFTVERDGLVVSMAVSFEFEGREVEVEVIHDFSS